MVAHVIQWWLMGKTVSPIEPSETMYTLQRGALNAGFIFFALAILATLIFGRFVCGWGCHILALQDFCAWLLKKMGLNPKPFRSRLLVYVPLIAALCMFVLPTVYRFFARPDDGPLIPHFTNHLVTTDFWETFSTVSVAVPFLFVCGFMTVYFLGQKGFCTYACPYGGFFGLADKLALGKIRVTDACNQCGHCTATCTSNVLVHAEVKHYGMVVDPGCMKCMDCVSVCPNDALYFGFGKPTLLVPRSKAIKTNYSLTWPEEIFGALIFAASFLAVHSPPVPWIEGRGVYGLVPFLMALGIASVTTFLALKTWRLFKERDQVFYKFVFKTAGKIRTGGWAFAIFAIAWIGLNVHCGFIRWHEYEGNRAFQSLRIRDELALAQLNPDRWLSAEDRQSIADGKRHFEIVLDYGLPGVRSNEALAKLAWFEYLSGNAEKSPALLEKAAALQRGQAKALSLYYRGAMLNRLGHFNEANASLDQALAARDDLILARQEKGESLWQLGRKSEAVDVWADTVRRNASLPLAANELAGAERAMGRVDQAAAYEKQADQSTPDDAYFHWMLALRLQSLDMTDLAEKHRQRATDLDAAQRNQ
jgi:tetratricopeptide (TPR) repeat protein/ferredoxin